MDLLIEFQTRVRSTLKMDGLKCALHFLRGKCKFISTHCIFPKINVGSLMFSLKSDFSMVLWPELNSTGGHSNPMWNLKICCNKCMQHTGGKCLVMLKCGHLNGWFFFSFAIEFFLVYLNECTYRKELIMIYSFFFPSIWDTCYHSGIFQLILALLHIS